MSRLLLINASINSTSTGRIAEEIGRKAIENGFESIAGYGFINNNSSLKTVKIGSTTDHYLHALKTRIFDRHGFGSTVATKDFLKRIKPLDIDIVNLHNIHGYYLNVEVLSKFLADLGKPVVWTFHDCWPVTGHCSYFDAVNCDRWKTGCFNCPNKHGYPASKYIDNSKNNFERKKRLFEAIPNLTIVAPCNWMAEIVRQSFLGGKDVKVIYNGVNTDVFKPVSNEALDKLKGSLGLAGKRIILGVASVWDKRKGLEDFKKLSVLLGEDERIVLIGLSDEQRTSLPENIIAISRTENVEQLAAFYSMADVFVNPTYVDNFPTTNIEALACGTSVITYNTGGSPEAVDANTGRVIKKGDLNALMLAIREMFNVNNEQKCRDRAIRNFDSRDRFNDYVNLFKELCITTH